ncbi:MAG TPA: hypothetical protein VFM42_09005 [Sphingomicrobium sp.]|nr:hypothetical protein [Sphingomicrobium sp.]
MKNSSAGDPCDAAKAASDETHIVICAPRPNGYRINPDIMEAKRELKSGGRPPRPGRTPDTGCPVGPMGCQTAGINLLAAGIAAVTMVEKAVKGENVGEMFITDPHPTEYQLYQMAKKRREEREAEEAAKAQVKAAAESAQPASARHVQQ